ncbi:MAG: CrcB family protein [Vicinamibacterales bacterium]|nr:CrcB family protein [Vicinamibacterales bacterium]
MIWLAVAVGGALGSLARHGANVLVALMFERPVPYATAAVNLAGSLAIGVLAGQIASGRLVMGQLGRAFVLVGILGGFTTFSSFMLDTLTLAHSGDRALAFSNVVGQTGLGLLAVYLGYELGALR